MNLRWNPRPITAEAARSGGFGRWLAPRRLEAQTPDYTKTADLDLGCFYELVTGRRGVVQAMGEQRGAFETSPYVRLDRDDPTGSSTGENLFINTQHHDEINRALIFVYIYSSNATFNQTEAMVSLVPSAGPPINIPLDTRDAAARSCAVALLTHQDGELILRRDVRYIRGYQADIDALYGFALRWTGAAKPTA